MSKNGRRATIVILCVLFIIDLIVVIRFFTKDNGNKGTIAKVDTSSVDVEKALVIEENVDENLQVESDNVEETQQIEETENVTEEVTEKNNNVENAVTQQSVSSRAASVAETTKTETSVVTTSNDTETTNTNIPVSEYKGYKTIGKIEIPKTGVNLPILSKQTVGGMEVAPCLLYSTGELNKTGNNLIVGHNYRNGKLFSNNNNLQIGDKIYITTLDGNRVEYVIYNKIITTPEDTTYLERSTSGNAEITLSSCTDDEVNRVVIFARMNG